MEMKNRIILLSMLFISMNVSAAQYPTEEIVRNVIDCMTELGGLNDTNMYTCTCRTDYIMSKMKYQEYDNAMTWDRNKQMPGDKGDTVRDNELGKKASNKYEKVLTESEAKCPVVKHLEPVKHKN
jgi:hypothetical protein